MLYEFSIKELWSPLPSPKNLFRHSLHKTFVYIWNMPYTVCKNLRNST